MKKLKLTKERIALILILIVSAILNFANIGIEGYGNQYYAAGVKSMTMSFKNFFFVSYDPAGFVSIDKPPLGFWIQTIFAKIFGYHGWSILLPQAIAGVISVYLIYRIVKKSFGSAAGLISAVCLAVTPIFVAVSRNNTIDNLLVMTLLFACLAFSKLYEKKKAKYLYICLLIIGIGFNIKMLQAYLIIPAVYLTYLIFSGISIKKKILNCVVGTVILAAVSLSWALVVDLVPAKYRPYVGSSTNNTVMELIFGHNGVERLSSSSNSGGGPQNGSKNGSKVYGPGQMEGQGNGAQGMPGDQNGQSSTSSNSTTKSSTTSQNSNSQNQQSDNQNSGNGGSGQQLNNQNSGGGPGQGGFSNNKNNSGSSSSNSSSSSSNSNTNSKMRSNSNQGNPPSMPNGGGKSGDGNMGGQGGGPGGQGGSQGGGQNSTFGGTTTAGLQRLFSDNSLSDQIIWLFPLAIFGFAAVLIKEKLKKPFSNNKILSVVFWMAWLLPEFIYFSFTKGLFHPYYLTMLAAPIAALSGIGITVMWDLFKEGGKKSFILPIALIVDGITQMLILSYYDSNAAAKVLMTIVAVATLALAAILIILNIIKYPNEKLKKILVIISVSGLLAAPAVWSVTPMIYGMSSSFPSAGLELSKSTGGENKSGMGGNGGMMSQEGMPNGNSNGYTNNSGNMNSSGNSQSNSQNKSNNTTSNNTENGAMPSAQEGADGQNSSTQKRSGMGGGMDGMGGNTTALIKFLKANAATEKYALVVSSANAGSEIIVKSGESVMALGGFTGNDNILTLAKFKQMVKNGEVRYALSSGNQGGNNAIMSWIKKNGKQITVSQDGSLSTSTASGSSSTSNSSSSSSKGGESGTVLYDLKGTVK